MSLITGCMKRLLVPAVVMTCMALPALAADLLVAPDGSGPYATIQDAIDAAGSGDSVVLMAGTYWGTGNRNLESDGSITIRRQNPDDEGIAMISWSGPFHPVSADRTQLST